MNWLWKRLADMPSTNARIFATLLVFLGTAGVYWATGKPPDVQWLGFIAVMAGVDALQFGAKRATFQAQPPSGKDIEDTPSKPTAPKATTAETLGAAPTAVPQDADEVGDDHRPPGPLK